MKKQKSGAIARTRRTPDSQNCVYPKELPEKPEGWTQILDVHLNFGPKGGAASYSLFDANGAKLPFGYGYDTRKGAGNGRGFVLPGIDGWLTWKQLRAAYPKFLEREGYERTRRD